MISGLYFTLLFILFPAALVIFFYQKGWILETALWIIVIFHLVIMGVYSSYHSYKVIQIYKLEGEYDKRFDKKIGELKKNKTISNVLEKEPASLKKSLTIFDKIFGFLEKTWVLLFFSIAIFYSVMINVKNGNILSITVIAILSFVNLTLIAITQGLSTAYYPPSKITMVDGKIIEGKALKFGEFLHLLNKDKKYFINKDQIKIIEQDVMKKKV
jgi:glucan phosphoethanolaminetransferase (alkaline phosphatase superfamily)